MARFVPSPGDLAYDGMDGQICPLPDRQWTRFEIEIELKLEEPEGSFEALAKQSHGSMAETLIRYVRVAQKMPRRFRHCRVSANCSGALGP
jgi:hypothetical protein